MCLRCDYDVMLCAVVDLGREGHMIYLPWNAYILLCVDFGS